MRGCPRARHALRCALAGKGGRKAHARAARRFGEGPHLLALLRRPLRERPRALIRAGGVCQSATEVFRRIPVRQYRLLRPCCGQAAVPDLRRRGVLLGGRGKHHDCGQPRRERQREGHGGDLRHLSGQEGHGGDRPLRDGGLHGRKSAAHAHSGKERNRLPHSAGRLRRHGQLPASALPRSRPVRSRLRQHPRPARAARQPLHLLLHAQQGGGGQPRERRRRDVAGDCRAGSQQRPRRGLRLSGHVQQRLLPRTGGQPALLQRALQVDLRGDGRAAVPRHHAHAL
mmetsp:Transcript_33478/g.73752  ORF Transcript_33478/g.73752 Transcript_33478/m.73752 type:complete len:285 (+) Transcript_33478:117-971(+)